jgi:membrane protease YdiL (CAAX protease family)
MVTALALGAVLGCVAWALRPSPTVAVTVPAVALAALILTAEELLLRGALQPGVETELGRAQSPARARAIAAAVSLALSVVMLVLGGRAAGATFAVIATHAAAVGARALTGRTTAAWLARFAATGIALLA